jgi:hypothetical protein
MPGQRNGMYHHERGQEDFLVVAGECVLLIEGEERRHYHSDERCTVAFRSSPRKDRGSEKRWANSPLVKP